MPSATVHQTKERQTNCKEKDKRRLISPYLNLALFFSFVWQPFQKVFSAQLAASRLLPFAHGRHGVFELNPHYVAVQILKKTT